MSFLVIPATHAHAAWSWLYPTPHGNNLNDVTFVNDATAIAVGEVGTIMVSHDAGVTWSTSLRTNGVASSLRRIDRVDDHTAVTVGDEGAILKTTDDGDHWTTISSGTLADLWDVSFYGAVGLTGGVAPTTMLRTTDAGDTWTPVEDVPVNVDPYSVEMASPMVAYCQTGDFIMKSLDGGLTWGALIDDYFLTGYSRVPLAFTDAMNGVVGGVSRIYITHDGGTTWTQESIGTVFVEGGSRPSDIEYRSPSTIVATVIETMCDVISGGNCSSWGDLFRSSDDGLTWAYDGGHRSFNGVASNSAGISIAVGVAGDMYRWSPPDTWQQIGGSTLYGDLPEVGSMAFHNAQEGVVLGTKLFYGPPTSADNILHTSTSGSSWSFSYWGNQYRHMNDIAAPAGSSDYYAIARPGDGATFTTSLLKSTDDGVTWSEVWTDARDLKLMSLEFSSPTHGVAVGNAGYAAVIDGDAVTTVAIATNRLGLGFADESVVIAVGAEPTPIVRSIDGGSTWTPVASPVSGTLYDAAFANPSVGVIVGLHGVVLRTIDGGLTWSQVTVPLQTGELLTAVAFAGNYGMALGGYSGTALETQDAGLTWSRLAVPATGLLSDVAVFGPRHALIAGSQLHVLEYRDDTVPTLVRALDVSPLPFGADLRWDVSTDEHLAGFSIMRSSSNSPRRTIASDLSTTTRSYRDDGLIPGTIYEYQLLAVDRDGSFTQSMPVKVTVPVASIDLLPNQPNPFNPVTTIRFVLPHRMHVAISVHDVAGRVVAVLLDDVRDAGVHELTWNATGLASGVYFAKLRAGKTEVSRKMVLLK